MATPFGAARPAPAPLAAQRATPPSSVAAPPATSAREALGAPPNRDAILSRLRDRAERLTPDAVASILAKRADR